MKRWLRRLLVPVLALIATGAFFCEYVPPFKRVHLFSDIEVYHYPLQRYAFQAAARSPQLKAWGSVSALAIAGTSSIVWSRHPLKAGISVGVTRQLSFVVYLMWQPQTAGTSFQVPLFAIPWGFYDWANLTNSGGPAAARLLSTLP
jgi:hypothetical protein